MRKLTFWEQLRAAANAADDCDAAMRELDDEDNTPRLVCPACGAGEHARCSRPPRTTFAMFAVCECACHDNKEAHR